MCCFLLSALEFEIKEESVLLSDVQSLLSFLTSAGSILIFPFKIFLLPAVSLC